MEQIKVFIGTLGMDQHELGAIAVSRLLRDAGMEVVYGGRFNLPPMIVKACLEEDVDVIGLSCHSWEFLYYLPDLLALMKAQKIDIPIVVGGSVITPGDSKKLTEMGIAGVLGPGAPENEIIETVKSVVKS